MQKITVHPSFILILGMLSMLPPLAIDMYLPSFLDIAQDLHTSEESVQATLAIFTAGFAVGQLFWGPVADSFGRKPVILIGLIASVIASYFLTQVSTIEQFYLARLVQGLGGAAPAVVLAALVRDMFARNQFAQMMSMIMIITMLAPLVAPIAGGYLAHIFHWHSVFYVLVIMGLMSAVLVAWRIPETLKPENRAPLHFGKVMKNFGGLIAHIPTLGYVLIGGLSFAGMFCFLTSGSIVYIQIFGVEKQYFGYFFILNVGVLMAMTTLNGKLISKFGSERMLQFGLILQLLAGLWLAVCGIFQLGLWPTAIGVAMFVGMISTIGSNANSAILDRYPQMAGTANALAGTARFGIGAIISAILSTLPATTERPMLFAMALCIISCVGVYALMCYKASLSSPDEQGESSSDKR